MKKTALEENSKKIVLRLFAGATPVDRTTNCRPVPDLAAPGGLNWANTQTRVWSSNRLHSVSLFCWNEGSNDGYDCRCVFFNCRERLDILNRGGERRHFSVRLSVKGRDRKLYNIVH